MRRGNANEQGYSSRWRIESKLFLRAHPLCQCAECGEGRNPGARVAEVVDHRKPHRGDQRLFWDQSNWQALSKRCHDRKTATEDGGFGRERIEQSSTRTGRG